MTTLAVRHTVNDFDRWKAGSTATTLGAAATGPRLPVLRDGNDVLALIEFPDAAAARPSRPTRFFARPWTTLASSGHPRSASGRSRAGSVLSSTRGATSKGSQSGALRRAPRPAASNVSSPAAVNRRTRAWWRSSRSASRFIATVDQALRHHHLSRAGREALAVLEGAGQPLPPTTIAQRLIVTTASITSCSTPWNDVARRARPDPEDRRKLLVAITDDGLALVDQFLPEVVALRTRSWHNFEPQRRNWSDCRHRARRPGRPRHRRGRARRAATGQALSDVTGGACPPAPRSRATCQSRSVELRLDEARGRQRSGCRGCRDWVAGLIWPRCCRATTSPSPAPPSRNLHRSDTRGRRAGLRRAGSVVEREVPISLATGTVIRHSDAGRCADREDLPCSNWTQLSSMTGCPFQRRSPSHPSAEPRQALEAWRSFQSACTRPSPPEACFIVSNDRPAPKVPGAVVRRIKDTFPDHESLTRQCPVPPERVDVLLSASTRKSLIRAATGARRTMWRWQWSRSFGSSRQPVAMCGRARNGHLSGISRRQVVHGWERRPPACT